MSINKRTAAFVFLMTFVFCAAAPIAGLAADAGQLSAFVGASDLTSTANAVFDGGEGRIVLPQLTGEPVQNEAGTYVTPSVTIAVGDRESNPVEAYAEAYLGDGEEEDWAKVTMRLPQSMLDSGDNEVTVTLDAGDGNTWTEAVNGRITDDGAKAVYVYHVLNSDGPYLTWANETDYAQIAVGDQITLDAAVLSEDSQAVAEACSWSVTAQTGSAESFVSWTTEGDGTAEPSVTLQGLSASGGPISITLTAAINGEQQTTSAFTLVVTNGTPSTELEITGSGDDKRVTGLLATADGTTQSEFFQMLGGIIEDASASIEGQDGELTDDGIVGTGMTLTIVRGGEEEKALIVVTGDVIGTGRVTVTQIVRMAKALTGAEPLEGVFLEAGDFGGSGSITVTDIVREANLLTGKAGA